MMKSSWIDTIRAIPGTLVSAGTESIQLYPMDGRIDNLVLVLPEYHSWIDSWRTMGIRVFCLEEHADEPSDIPGGNTGRLLLHPRTISYLKSLPQPIHVLMFKPDADSTKALEANGFFVLGCDPVLARRLENKLLFPAIARDAGIEIPQTRPLLLGGNPRIGSGSLPMRAPFICQFAKGFSGNRTFVIRSEQDWSILNDRFSGRKCRISHWSEGDTWTANGCVFRDGSVIVTPPFLQETRFFQPPDGLPPRIGSRGNRWGGGPEAFFDGIRSAMRRLGTVLQQRGYRGFFGADLIVVPPDNRILAIEINPRITASAPVLTPFEMAGDNPPLIAAHIAASLDTTWPWMNSPQSPPMGGQLIFRPDGTPVPDRLRSAAPGVYRTDGINPDFDRSEASILQIQAGEYLVWKPPTSECSSEIMRIIYRHDPDNFLKSLNLPDESS